MVVGFLVFFFEILAKVSSRTERSLAGTRTSFLLIRLREDILVVKKKNLAFSPENAVCSALFLLVKMKSDSPLVIASETRLKRAL